jgi:hypothetical protein
MLKRSNQGNLVYLALITDRIPVLPKFTPSHVLMDGSVGDLPFGEVFDIPLLSLLIKSPVLEWRDIKIDESPAMETMGCWAIWSAQQPFEHAPREGWFPRGAGLGRFLLLFLVHYSSDFVQTSRLLNHPLGSRRALTAKPLVSGILPGSASPTPAESGCIVANPSNRLPRTLSALSRIPTSKCFAWTICSTLALYPYVTSSVLERPTL